MNERPVRKSTRKDYRKMAEGSSFEDSFEDTKYALGGIDEKNRGQKTDTEYHEKTEVDLLCGSEDEEIERMKRQMDELKQEEARIRRQLEKDRLKKEQCQLNLISRANS